MVFLKNFADFEKTKDIFFRYCNHFKVLSQEELFNDRAFVQYHQKIIKQYPELAHYAYQVALEQSYSKRLFSQDALNDVFKESFIIIDHYGLNKGLCDASTINTALIVEKIKNESVFKDSTFVVNATPLEYHTSRYYSIQKALGSTITQSKIATGNTNCDLFIDNYPYDIKNTSSDRVNLSHILCWPYEKFNAGIESHLKNMFYHMQTIVNNKKTKNLKFFKQAKDKLQSIIENKSISLTEKNSEWHRFIYSNSGNIPPDFHYSLVFQMTSCDSSIVTPKHILEKLHVAPDVLEQPKKALMAINGIVNLHNKDVQTRATIATCGVIDGALHNINIESFSQDDLD